MIQGSVAPSHRGRVISLYSLNGRAGPAVGAMVMGFLSHILGLQIPVGVAGAMGFVVVLWTLRHRHAIAAASENVVFDDDDVPIVREKSKAAE